MATIFRSAVNFMGLQWLGVGLCILFPADHSVAAKPVVFALRLRRRPAGRDNSDLVWSDISPYNLRPYRNSYAFGWFKSKKMTKNVIPKQWRE